LNLFQWPGCHTFKSYFNRLYFTVIIKFHFVNACYSMVVMSLLKRSSVINNIIFVFIWDLDHRMMPGTCRYLRILLQNDSFAFKGAEWSIRNSISHLIIRAAPASFRPHEIVLPVFDKHKWTLHIILWRYLFIQCAIIKWNQRSEVLIELYHVAMAPATIIHVVRSIFVFKYKLVYGLRPIYNLIDQWFPDNIFKRTFRFVCHSHTYSAYLPLM